MLNFMSGSNKNIYVFNILFVLIIIISLPACETLSFKDQYPLITAAQTDDIIKAEESLKENADINYITEIGEFALLNASLNGNLEMVQLLIENGADVNLANHRGMTSTMAAVSKGNEEVVNYLIDNGADLTTTNQMGLSVLHIAIMAKNQNLLQLLIDNNALINDEREDWISPLFLAVKNGNKEAAEVLIANNADLDRKDKSGSTALHMAVMKANHELFMLLLEKGADIHIKDAKEEDAFQIFAGIDYDEIMNIVFERIKEKTKDFDAVNAYNEDSQESYNLIVVLKVLATMEPKYDTKEKKKFFAETLEKSTLSIDISEKEFDSVIKQLKTDYFSIARAFLENGVDVNSADRESRTAIMKICSHDNRVSTKFKDKQISLKTDVEKRFNQAFKTAENIYIEMMQLFISAGADVNMMDSQGRTALLAVCGNGNSDFAEFLLENGADVNIADNEGWTPLISAVSAENIHICELLVSRGANVNAANSFGETALLKAVHRKNVPLVRLLVNNGADAGIKNSRGDSPLSVAQKKGYSEIVSILEVGE